MDLLALSTADGQLCLHRLNWQRLWAVSPESSVTSLCWRPDGKVLACGYEDGFISLLDVENGDTMQRGKMVAGDPDQGLFLSISTFSLKRSMRLQVLHLPLAGWKSELMASYLRAAWHINHVQQSSVELLLLPHLRRGQPPGRFTTKAEQTTLTGLCCQRDWT